MENSSPFILVDGSSYLFRAYHALPPLISSKGQATGAIKGVISMLKRLLEDYCPTHIAVVFDAKGKTFRHDLYPDYKANRPPMPEDLASQIAPLHQLVKDLGLPLICIPGVEADDVIGTLAVAACQQGWKTLISTGDKDMAQLVSPNVTLVNTMNKEVLDSAGVEEKFGVPPDKITDYLALLGDKSDNVPGLTGVGQKSAVALLAYYDGVEALIADPAHAAELGIRGGKKLPEKIIEHAEQLALSLKLVTIDCDLELEHTLSSLSIQAANKEALVAHYNELEFKAWALELATPMDEPNHSTPDQLSLSNETLIQEPITAQCSAQHDSPYETIVTPEALQSWVQRLSNAPLISVDTETSGLDYMTATLVGLSFSCEAKTGCYIPIAHTGEGSQVQLSPDLVLSSLRPLLENTSPAKVGQNLKFDSSILARAGIKLNGISFDTMLESYVLNSVATRHNMDALAQYYLDRKTVTFEEVAGKGAKQITFDQVALDIAAHYAAEDADITFQLHQTLLPLLKASPELWSVFTDIELPLLTVLSEIERHGALLNVEALQKQSQVIDLRIEELKAQVFDIAGETFNLDSPKQLGAILYDKLQLPILKKTPKGAPSTAEAVLIELALEYPLPKLLLDYRGLAKLKSTYTDKLPLLVNAETGRLHTSYHQAVTATGRLSSSDPNLQNIPIRSAEGRKVREAFIAPEGAVIVAADYSQIELRIMAHLSQDLGLLKAFNAGIDVHRATAAEVFGVAPEEVSDNQRRDAKAINFGLIYGMSAFGLAKQLGLGRAQAQEYINLYFERYPGVLSYMESTREVAHQKGFVETVFGRRLYLPEINSKNKMRQQAVERTAINAPMQGTAADIIKKAMLMVSQWLQCEGLASRMIMQVHDELVLEVPNVELAIVTEKLPDIMSQAATLSVPLLVDVGVGANWGEAH